MGDERGRQPGTTVLVVTERRLHGEAIAAALCDAGCDATHVLSNGDLGYTVGRAAAARPDVVLLDFDIGPPSAAWFSALVGNLVTLGAWVLAVADEDDRYRVAEALEAGVTGVVGTSRSVTDLLQLIDDTMSGLPVLSPSTKAELLQELADVRVVHHARLEPFARLSPREAQVLGLLMSGRSVRRIAASRCVSVATIRTQIRSVLTKLGVQSQLAAVAMARDAGWDPLGGRRRAG